MDITYRELEPETLRAVIESYVNREGTDYGAVEMSLERKVADVLAQLESGEAQIVFDPETDTIDIVTAS